MTLKAVAWAYSALKKHQTRNIQVFEESKLPDSVRTISGLVIYRACADARELVKVTRKAIRVYFICNKSVSFVTDTNTVWLQRKRCSGAC